MTTAHRYPKSALLGDYLRGGGGLALTAGPALFAPMFDALQIIFAAIALLFAGFILRTWQRQATTIELHDEGLRVAGPLGRDMAWQDVRKFALSYFSTRRDRTSGWMQLTVRDGRGKISIDSSLDGFDEVLSRCAEAATRNNIELSTATIENLKAAGIAVAVSGGAGPPDGEKRH